jgi:3-oxoacyl-[acyl-carrier-protein] synthase-3
MTVLRQDASILGDYIVAYAAKEMKTLVQEGLLKPASIDHFIPHISSFAFYHPLHEGMLREGINIPQEKWYLNLADRGNTGSAYIYCALDEFLERNLVDVGETVLLMVPESARFGYGFVHLTCVRI